MKAFTCATFLILAGLTAIAQTPAATAVAASEDLPLDGTTMNLRVNSTMAGVNVMWVAGDTANLLQYEVQRSNEFGDWSTIFRLPARRALIGLDESFEDPQPFNGFNAYRIARIDRGGGALYSETRALTYLGLRGIRLYPNPVAAGQPVYVEFLGTPLAEFQLELIDDRGKRLDYQNFSGTGAMEQVSFVPDAPHAGSYAVRLYSNEIPLESWPLQIR